MQPIPSFSLLGLIPLGVGLFIAFIGGVFLFTGLRSRRKAEAALEWPSASGRVLSTEVREHVRHDADTGPRRQYEPVVEYEYSLMGSPMRGSRLSFGAKHFNTRAKAEAFLEPYAPGSVITVYYDPQDPAQSVVEREASGSMTQVIMGALFLVFGLGLGCLMGGIIPFLSSFAR